MRNSFRNPITNVLTAHGFVTQNLPGELMQPEADDFALEPGRWRWNGTRWVTFIPPPPPSNPLVAKIDLALAEVNVPQVIKDILSVWKTQL